MKLHNWKYYSLCCCIIFVFSQVKIYAQDTLWERVNSKSTHECVSILKIDSEGNIVFATRSKVYRSGDNGISWQEISPPFKIFATIKTVLQYSDSNIFVGTRDDGLYNSTNNGKTWVKKSDIPYSTVVRSIIRNNRGRIYLSTGSDEYYSDDKGKNWQRLINLLHHDFYGVREFFLTSSGYIVACLGNDVEATTQIFRFIENGSNLNEIYIKNDEELNIIPSNSRIMFLRGKQSNLYASTDYGATWISKDAAPPSIIGIIEFSENKIIAATQNDGIYFSENGGMSWDRASSGLTTLEINSIVLNPDEYIYVGTNSGIFRIKIKSLIK